MLLTLSTVYQPATDLGYLLHKNPDRVQSFELPFGEAHVFYPDRSSDRCTCALLLDIDPIGLVRRAKGPDGEAGMLRRYVNDRPYTASSFMSVAIARVFGSALHARSKERPDLVDQSLPLEAKLAVLPVRGGERVLRDLFEPLGYEVEATRHPLNPDEPAWGSSRYFTVTLRASKRVADLLSHLYVLIPVLDDEKHYWVSQDEVEKLLRFGTGWLETHPARETIATRYLKHQTSLVRAAVERLTQEEAPGGDGSGQADREEQAVEETISLNRQRLEAVLGALKETGAARVLDLGCGEGRLTGLLLKDRQFRDILAMDVSWRALEIAESRLKLDRLPASQRERVRLMHGSLMYRDERLAGFDAAAAVEVIEHLDPPRLTAFERTVFEFARPGTVVVTTPNAEYNVKWESLPADRFRHRDHRFEWTRAEFALWGDRVAAAHGYSVRYASIGESDPELGGPTQMAVFSR
ncbi:MAG: 3' terminal RNA ribose 2'-O-methyltransferase Hen1 [Gemmatimonadota bacterium]|nr:3' terminal RNA ribose 2'-O-methyltransferase Hen1 [Gemmatimonadota bacterium]